MRLLFPEYQELERQLCGAWADINEATDTPDSDKAVRHLEDSLRKVLVVGRTLHPEVAAAASDRDAIAHLTHRYRHKLFGAEGSSVSLTRLATRMATGAIGADMSDALLVGEALPALWRIVRGLRGDLKRRRPGAYYLHLLKKACLFGVAVGLLYHAAILFLPWGAWVVYYRGTDLRWPVGVGVENALFRDYSHGGTSVFAGAHNWSARWSGCIRTPEAGTYEFYVQSNDGLRFYLDDKLIVDNWRNQDWLSSGRHASVRLSKGRHRFRIEYYKGPKNGGALRVRWTGCGIPPNTTLGMPHLYKY